MTREEIILARIRLENGSVSVCSDDVLSMFVRQQMLNKPWPLLDNNMKTYKEYGSKTSSYFRSTLESDSLQVFNVPGSISPPLLNVEADMEELLNNKDIMWKIPPKTNFRFLKRILNRILRLTNRYQQSFNNAVHRILSELIGTLEWVKNGLFLTDDKANKAIEKADSYISNLHDQQEEWLSFKEQIDLFIEDTKNQLEAIHVQDTYFTETMGSFSFRIDEAEKKLDNLQNQANYNSNQLSAQNYRVQTIERKIEQLNYGLNPLIGEETNINYFSQSGEDAIVDYILNRCQIMPSDVTYLDLGANHAKYLSNTYYFYQKKAHGILVEANPALIPELEQYRKGDIVLNRCIATETGKKIAFYVTNYDGLSSTNIDTVLGASQITPEVQISQTVEIESVSVNDLFENYFNTVPTFVSMDLEGIEMDILSTIDFDSYRPLIYIIETIPYRAKLVASEKEMAIVEFMQTKGYVEYAFTGINSIFIDQRQLKTL